MAFSFPVFGGGLLVGAGIYMGVHFFTAPGIPGQAPDEHVSPPPRSQSVAPAMVATPAAVSLAPSPPGVAPAAEADDRLRRIETSVRARVVDAAFDDAQLTAIVAAEAAIATAIADRDVDSADVIRARIEELKQLLGEQDYGRYVRAMGRADGIAVARVLPAGAGERAGLRPGDEIVRFGGTRVYSVGELRDVRAGLRRDADLVFRRDGAEIAVRVPKDRLDIEVSVGRRKVRL